ncbi:MAG: hypothetical protein BM564_11820 [Bacteroidetes bacterium MedPE-SWsnd-G2]|nr:MAG: hypothetical protein BM564_11820 [Bacteroidetes bacterium MedPE-SWsnd-G2]
MSYLKYCFLAIALGLMSCNSDSEDCCPINNQEPQLIIKFKFNPEQLRLNNLGELSVIPEGNASQSPNFQTMSANYIEFAPSASTILGDGEIIYEGPKTDVGGALAIDFNQAVFAGNNETFISIPLSQVSSGQYNWVRVSLAYQEGDIQLLSNGNLIEGTLASFVGFNTYIDDINLNNQIISVNENKLQGFWAFEALGFTTSGQAPEGATTVPNPLFETSPIPQGSCVVTGQFSTPFQISGEETQDVEVSLSFSTNQSFEWTEVNPDGFYEPSAGEQLVDMGLRGLIPYHSN